MLLPDVLSPFQQFGKEQFFRCNLSCWHLSCITDVGEMAFPTDIDFGSSGALTTLRHATWVEPDFSPFMLLDVPIRDALTQPTVGQADRTIFLC